MHKQDLLDINGNYELRMLLQALQCSLGYQPIRAGIGHMYLHFSRLHLARKGTGQQDSEGVHQLTQWSFHYYKRQVDFHLLWFRSRLYLLTWTSWCCCRRGSLPLFRGRERWLSLLWTQYFAWKMFVFSLAFLTIFDGCRKQQGQWPLLLCHKACELHQSLDWGCLQDRRKALQ